MIPLGTKRFLLWIWKWMPGWMQLFLAAILRPHYQVAVAGLIFNRDQQLLLCEHTYRRKIPWGLPGGDLKFGEDPAQAVRREILEETGLRVNEVRLVLVDNSSHYRHVCLIYSCTGAQGDFVPNEEVDRICYFDLDSLPPMLTSQLDIIRRALAQPGTNIGKENELD